MAEFQAIGKVLSNNEMMQNTVATLNDTHRSNWRTGQQ